uniref:Uncharacterized protein n=1 Tax=Anguilla anguilla TaxID=7936 RepID=A0A0E9S9D2_ANGAN
MLLHTSEGGTRLCPQPSPMVGNWDMTSVIFFICFEVRGTYTFGIPTILLCAVSPLDV